MTVDYRGETVIYDAFTKTYSRPRVPIYRICKNGFKRELRADDQGCPCYKCGLETKWKQS